MFHSMKVSALVAGMFVTPLHGQTQDMIDATAEPAAEVQSFGDYSYLPPWEASDMVDPPLPADAEGVAAEEVAVEEDPFGESAAAEAGPEPAYWVAGTDEDDEPVAGEEHLDGMDDDSGMVPPTDEDAYVNEYEYDYGAGVDDDSNVEEEAEADSNAQAYDEYTEKAYDDTYEDEYTEEYYNDYDEEHYSYEPEENTTDDSVVAEVTDINEPIASEAVPTEDDTTDHTLDSEWYGESKEYDPFAVEETSDGESHTEDADETYDADEEYTEEEYGDEEYREEYEDHADEYSDDTYATEDEVATTDETPENDGTDASVDRSELEEDVTTELPIDPALVRVIANWNQLSPESRKAILSLVQQEALESTLDR